MDPGFLCEQVKITKVADAAGAGTTAVNGAGVDMQADGGWDAVLFLTSYGTPAANNLMKAQQSDDDASADDYTDIAGSEVDASGASDEDQWLDIQRPRKRYVRPVVQRGTSSTCENIWAIQYRGRKVVSSAINLVSGTIYGKKLYHPDEGTA